MLQNGIMGALRQSGWLATFIVAMSISGWPQVGVAEEDHLEGYRIKDLNQVVPPANPYTLTNQFGSESCELKKAQFFLVQSEKNSGDDMRGGPAGDFVCYKAKCTGTLPPVTAANSQFGLHSLETRKAKLVCLPVHVPEPCQASVGGSCWFLGAAGESCDTVCASNGRLYDNATASYAGSGGTDAECEAVLTALGVPGTVTSGGCSTFSLTAEGCLSLGGISERCVDVPTSSSAANLYAARACACQ